MNGTKQVLQTLYSTFVCSACRVSCSLSDPAETSFQCVHAYDVAVHAYACMYTLSVLHLGSGDSSSSTSMLTASAQTVHTCRKLAGATKAAR